MKETFLSAGQVIIDELLSSDQFKQKRGKAKQLTVIGVIGRMEEGKSTLMRQLNKWSPHTIKIVLDDKSLMSMKQDEIDEFTKIRHLYPDKRILLVIAAHRYKLLHKTIRSLCTAIIWVSPPPPWEMEDVKYFQRLQDNFAMEFPDSPYTGMIIWRNWVTQQTEWGWIGWKNISSREVEWSQQGFNKTKVSKSKSRHKRISHQYIRFPWLYYNRWNIGALGALIILLVYASTYGG